MDINAVLDELATKLATVDGLTVYDHPPGSVVAPAAIVALPDRVDFDATYGRGMDRIQLPIVLAVAKPTDKASRDTIAAYCSGSGSSSVKQFLEAGPHTAFHHLRVESVEFDVIKIGATDYVAAIFTCDIAGSGSS